MSEESEQAARLIIRQYVGFTVIVNETETEPVIETAPFLEASRELVSVIDSFGKLFTPIVYDMNNNIQKIKMVYEKHPSKYDHLEKILIEEKSGSDIQVASAMLWLKRALELISLFFYNIINEPDEKSELKDALRDAYENTLKNYHKWVVRNAFALVYRWVPTRQYLFGTSDVYADNMKHLQEYQDRMYKCLKEVDKLIKKHDFDDQAKV